MSAGRRPSLYVALSYAAFLGLPLAGYVIAASVFPSSTVAAHYLVATAYALTAVMILLEARIALPRRRAPRGHADILSRVPRITVIVSAYLPNERALIEETIVHLSTQMHVPSHRLQVILAYNTPGELPVEEALGSLAILTTSFTPLYVPGSRSKAENIVAALAVAEGEMTVLLDADHRPLPDAFERAYRWLLDGYDVVQGRCVIRNQTQNLLTRYVAVEFEHMYGIAHAGRSLSVDTAIFGGSNGYWRTEALRDIAMDPTMLTEDIDSTVRALLAGYRLVHDRSVVSSELAVTDLRHWWRQRLRWAQGWFQVTLRHQRAIWSSERLDSGTKAYWTYLLLWRELFTLLSLQVFALIGATLVLGNGVDWLAHPYLIATTVLTLGSGPIASIAAYRVALWRTKERLRLWFAVYALTNLAYVIAKNTVAMAAMMRELLGERSWLVTPRTRES